MPAGFGNPSRMPDSVRVNSVPASIFSSLNSTRVVGSLEMSALGSNEWCQVKGKSRSDSIGKKATLLMANDGVYEQGSAWEGFNFVTPYLRTIFGFMGNTDVHFIAAGGTKELVMGKVDPQTFLAVSVEKVRAQASR
jgi:hypothetical protein